MRRTSKVVVTQNFERNLERVERFLESHGRGQVFDALVDDVLTRVVPMLESTPNAGPPFLAKAPLSAEARVVLKRVMARLDGRVVRQLVRGDFVLLYATARERVYLLAVRHHREQAFQLGGSLPAKAPR